MNGTQLLRRSASTLLAGSIFAVSACSAEFGGLFVDEAGTDAAAAHDAGKDVDSNGDRTPDVRVDGIADSSSTDGSTPDVGGDAPNDGRAGGDAASDASLDTDSSRDADASLDGDVDGDGARDADASHDGSADIGSDPQLDVVAEDTASEPRLDAPNETAVDVVADIRADTPVDAIDVAPPGGCPSACSNFADIGQTIVRTVDQGAPPAMTGGTIVDGTYLATSVVQYNGDNQAYSISETSIISGNVDSWVSTVSGGMEVRYTTTFTSASNQIVFTFCCPGTGSVTISYTTDGSTLSHIDPANPNRVITYTRQ